jgi:proteasome lid subunit RPN8/RPN11
VIELDEAVLRVMLAHAELCAPRECCGLLIRSSKGELLYLAARNLYEGRAGEDRFQLDPLAWLNAEDLGTVVAVVHSHPNASANPSMADRVGCERSGLPWVVMGWPSGVVKQLQPCGWQAPYKGRVFAHGVLDCYTLIQDWFLRERGVALPDFDREDDWWKAQPGKPAQDLYMDNFTQAGFVRVQGQPQRHDVVLMQVMSDRANHGAVYLGGGVMLHHLHSRLSCEDVYGGYWLRHTLALLRHQSVVAA